MTTYLIIGIFIGIFAGLIIAAILIKIKAQSLMFFEDKSVYDFVKTEEVLTKAITDAGWKIPYVHDLQETLKKNNFDVRQVKVMEICKPSISYRILGRSNERIASNLMPCRIAIYEKSDGQIYFSRLNASLVSSLMKGTIPAAMKKAGDETEEILKSILK